MRREGATQNSGQQTNKQTDKRTGKTASGAIMRWSAEEKLWWLCVLSSLSLSLFFFFGMIAHLYPISQAYSSSLLLISDATSVCVRCACVRVRVCVHCPSTEETWAPAAHVDMTSREGGTMQKRASCRHPVSASSLRYLASLLSGTSDR